MKNILSNIFSSSRFGKKYILLFLIIFAFAKSYAQDNILPAAKTDSSYIISNATVHTGNGKVLLNHSILITEGKIMFVYANANADVSSRTAKTRTIDATGKHVYPGLILPDSDLGLKEIAGAVRGTNDYREIGELNPSVRSIVAYNTESRVINTLRANGILLAAVTPQGGYISGSSSVVQLDAWNYEDAAYKTDNGIHINLPSLVARQGRRRGGDNEGDAMKAAYEKIDELKTFFREAKVYFNAPTHAATNLKFEAVKNLYDKKQKLFVHCNAVKEMLVAVDFAKEFSFDVVIVGGNDSWQIADLLKQNNIAVILNPMHNLPISQDDDVDQPYKTPYLLQKAGVLFCINDDHGEARYRNLPFNAGTAAAYGLTKEQALQAVTLNAAKILGIDTKTGSIEVGKDANIVISNGDILDMRTNIITDAFIQGRKISLENKQTQLYEKYNNKPIGL